MRRSFGAGLGVFVLAAALACTAPFSGSRPGSGAATTPLTMSSTAPAIVGASPRSSVGLTTDGPEVGRSVIEDWFAQRPAMVTGRYGVLDNTAYSPDLRRLSEEPPAEGEFTQRFGDFASYLAFSGPEQLSANSSLVVRGTAVAFSRPYFNSLDWSYWDDWMIGAEAGFGIGGSQIARDVLFRVDEVLAGDPGDRAQDGLLEFTVPGGRAIVEVPDIEPAPGKHGEPPGRYLYADPPPVDLERDEEVVLFLNDSEWDGLYLDGGTRYGYVFKLAPAHDLYYRWLVKGDDVVNEGWGWNEQMSLDELRELVSGPGFGSAEDGPAPDDEIHPPATYPPGHDR